MLDNSRFPFLEVKGKLVFLPYSLVISILINN